MSARTRLLAAALVIVAILPIAIFATDFTQSGMIRAARRRVQERERGSTQPRMSDSARREMVRVRRARRHPTPGTIAESMAFQLIMIVVIGAAGRKIFALRL